jgi:hypothetical protein
VQSQQEVADAINTVLAQAMQPEAMHRRLREALESAAAPKATPFISTSPLWSLPDRELAARSRAKQERLAEAQRKLDNIDAAIPVQERAELKQLEGQLKDIVLALEVRLSRACLALVIAVSFTVAESSMLICKT